MRRRSASRAAPEYLKQEARHGEAFADAPLAVRLLEQRHARFALHARGI